MSECHWDGDDLIVAIRVQPRASREKILGTYEGRIKVALTAPPVDGAANEALQRFLAKELGVALGCVRIVQGEQARNKLMRILKPDRSRVTDFFQKSGLSIP
ncbi:MAG: YggU family protein [Magnetococcales bacterium]|nr:YggU family protein [Magnetococcales bacterium]MBF0437907.1 YggU family protein [Magnetococcales bacterium]